MNDSNITSTANKTLGLNETIEILTNTGFRVGNFIKAVVGVTGISMNILLIMAVVQLLGQHKNIRILLCNTSFCCIVAAFSMTVKSLRVLFATDFQQFVVNQTQCKAEEFVFGASYVCLTSIMSFIAIERFVATRFFETYYTWSSALGWFLTVMAWTFGVSVQSTQFMADSGRTVPFCDILLASNGPRGVALFLIIAIGISILIIPVYYLLVRLNRKRLNDFLVKQAHCTLTGRMELRHNISTAAVFIPTVIVHSGHIILIAGFQLLIVIKIFEPDPNAWRWVFYTPWCDALNTAQSITYPAIILWKHPSIRKKIKDMLHRFAPNGARYYFRNRVHDPQIAADMAKRTAMTPADYMTHLKGHWGTDK